MAGKTFQILIYDNSHDPPGCEMGLLQCFTQTWSDISEKVILKSVRDILRGNKAISILGTVPIAFVTLMSRNAG